MTSPISISTDQRRHLRLQDICLHPEPIRRGLMLLLERSEKAEQRAVDAWKGAVGIRRLFAEGMSRSDLRWLVCVGYLDHRIELISAATGARVFRHFGPLHFTRGTRFLLTSAGLHAAHVVREEQAKLPKFESVSEFGGIAVPQLKIPNWDNQRRQLRFNRLIVKEFKLPSPNQERVLEAFQEEGWPIHIDDPISPADNICPKRRLHDTIKSLNRNQKSRAIYFSGDGTGQGVLWSLRTDCRNT